MFLGFLLHAGLLPHARNGRPGSQRKDSRQRTGPTALFFGMFRIQAVTARGGWFWTLHRLRIPTQATPAFGPRLQSWEVWLISARIKLLKGGLHRGYMGFLLKELLVLIEGVLTAAQKEIRRKENRHKSSYTHAVIPSNEHPCAAIQ